MIDWFHQIEWASPEYLYLLLAIPVLVLIHWRRRRPALHYSSLGLLRTVPRSGKQRLKFLLVLMPMLIILLLVVGLARPRVRNTMSKISAEGIDIVLAIDISRSMMIEDLGTGNRLDVAKQVAENFVAGRTSDRVGLVLFAGKSFTQCPLTVDYAILTSLIRQVRIGMVEDGTAIGMGLINSINRLRESTAKSKVVILLTDGQNNRGEIDPITAAQIAQALGIRVYTIGAGKDGMARIPVDDPFFGRQYVSAEVKIDEDNLRRIAETTGGRYFRATSQRMLEEIYVQIGQMEKTKIDVRTYLRYDELYPYLVIPAMFMVLLLLIVRKTVLFQIP